MMPEYGFEHCHESRSSNRQKYHSDQSIAAPKMSMKYSPMRVIRLKR